MTLGLDDLNTIDPVYETTGYSPFDQAGSGSPWWGGIANQAVDFGLDWWRNTQNAQIYDQWRRNQQRHADEAIAGQEEAGRSASEGTLVSPTQPSPIQVSQPGTPGYEHVQRWRTERGLDPNTGEPVGYRGANQLAAGLSGQSAADAAGAAQQFQDVVNPSGLIEGYDARYTAGQTAAGEIAARANVNTLAGEAGGAVVEAGGAARTAQARAQMQNLLSGYQTRLNTGMGILSGSGAQERRDINRQFNQFGGAVAQDLTSRGATGSTIGAGLQAGVERTRADALGGANARLRQQQAGLYSDLSGQGLQAQFNTIGLEAGLSGEELNNLVRQMTQQANLGRDEIGVMQSNAGALAGLSGESLAAQGALGAAQLGYTTDRFDRDLNRQFTLGQYAIETGYRSAQDLTNLRVNGIQHGPPFQY